MTDTQGTGGGQQPASRTRAAQGSGAVSPDGTSDGRAAGAVGGAAGTVTRLRRVAGDAGMATAEYAIATLAAVGFAGLLVVILKGNEVKGLLTGIVRQALGG
ncbi:DUF4244 domain-containing protein [Cellulomonas sp. 179-A 9B4 NHS]|uniref:DUF4244 domain-containing protein n=1 Tax=Cellulomonas sp. 179-A 9B4 NHS TaxID=3142379 RepID=UPI0039A22725